MRIMIGPVEVAGIGAGLKAGFDRIGGEAELVLSLPHPFDYGRQSQHSLARIWMKLGRLYDRSSRKTMAVRLLTWAPWRAWSLIVMIWALMRYDSFIFLFGNTITNSRLEAQLYAWTGKKVVIVYCGSDARPAYIDGPAVNHPRARRRLARITSVKRRRIASFEALGFVLVNSPSSAQLHARPFVNWFLTGIPRDVDETAPPNVVGEDRSHPRVRILHSPSAPIEKGTARILETIERLKAEGLSIDFVLLRGVPNSRVRQELARCDFIVDQIYSDQPMATFAVEAAHFGRPAVVAGYAAVAECRHLFSPLPPSLFVHPDELESAIRQMVADVDGRRALGARAREFVLARWSAEQAAKTFTQLLTSGPRPDQLIDPGPLRYLHGYGISEQAARSAVGEVFARGGVSALHLSHNRELEQAFVRFACGSRDLL